MQLLGPPSIWALPSYDFETAKARVLLNLLKIPHTWLPITDPSQSPSSSYPILIKDDRQNAIDIFSGYSFIAAALAPSAQILTAHLSFNDLFVHDTYLRHFEKISTFYIMEALWHNEENFMHLTLPIEKKLYHHSSCFLLKPFASRAIYVKQYSIQKKFGFRQSTTSGGGSDHKLTEIRLLFRNMQEALQTESFLQDFSRPTPLHISLYCQLCRILLIPWKEANLCRVLTTEFIELAQFPATFESFHLQLKSFSDTFQDLSVLSTSYSWRSVVTDCWHELASSFTKGTPQQANPNRQDSGALSVNQASFIAIIILATYLKCTGVIQIQ